jgi:hypothetical protein
MVGVDSVRFIVLRCLLGAVVLVATLYVSDDLFVRYRVAHRGTQDPLEAMRFYYATVLKNGKLEVFYDQPQVEVCVHSLFPHLGYRPCWYVSRTKVKVVAVSYLTGFANEPALLDRVLGSRRIRRRRAPPAGRRREHLRGDRGAGLRARPPG